MADKPHVGITTVIVYPNGPPHIGPAYEVIATDAIVLFMRLDGHHVFSLTRSDEHGIKMHQTATLRGSKPRELADRTSRASRRWSSGSNARTTTYIRTTEERQITACPRLFWERMAKAGDIYLSKYSGWYGVCYAVNQRRGRDDPSATTRLAPRPDRHAGRSRAVEWSYFFRLSAISEETAGPRRSPNGISCCRASG